MIGRWSRARLGAALPLALVVLGVAAFDLRYHEFWRDEANAMLEARDVPFHRLLGVMHLEGVPPLFHALLRAVGLVFPAPVALGIVGAIGLATLLFGTYRLLVAVSHAPRASAWVAVAFSLTYVYAYELGVMIRQYALGLGLALLSIAYLREALGAADRRKVWAGTIAAALSALTSAHSSCVAGAAVLAYGVLSLTRRRGVRLGWPILLTLPSFALVLYLAAPYEDRTAEANQVLAFPPAISLRLAVQALIEGVMPIDWWASESLGLERFAGAVAALRRLAFGGLLAAAALVFAARLGALRARFRPYAFDALTVGASWVPLLLITIHHYWGSFRHHLFLGVPAVVILAGAALERRPPPGLATGALRAAAALLAPWFLLQHLLCAADLALDQRYPFSDTKSASMALPARARVVADAAWRSAGMMLYRPDLRMRSASWEGARYRYIRPDAMWHREVPVSPLVRIECKAAPKIVYFAGLEASLGSLSACARPVDYPKSPLVDHPFTWESFDLFHLDCACVAVTSDGDDGAAWRP